ncbi:MAG: hypothetical protein WC849_03050 [Candidatus Paceibacterota bacterium]
MGILAIGLFLTFTISLIVLSFSSKSENKFISFVVCIFSVVLLSLCLYGEIAVPVSVSDIGVYNPFDNGEIYKKYWESERNNEYLFSVVKITETEKDTLDEIFSSDTRNLQVIKTNKDYLVILDQNFYSITEEQKDEILKLDLDVVQIKKHLGWKRF